MRHMNPKELLTGRTLKMDPDTVATVQKELRARLEEFVPLFNGGFRQHELHAPDGIFMPHMLETVHWHSESKNVPKGVRMIAKKMDVVDITVTSPKSAFTVTVLHLVDTDKEEDKEIKSLTIWKKYDGEWRMFRDMYNGK